MSRIDQTFAALQSQKKKALITFITAGDPAPELTVPLMHAMVNSGVDILELGVPFSDPMAEGPVIQRANERALAKGVTNVAFDRSGFQYHGRVKALADAARAKGLQF